MNPWKNTIKNMLDEGSTFTSLAWSDEEWDKWIDGDFTPEQEELLSACAEFNLVPYPGERGADTISFH